MTSGIVDSSFLVAPVADASVAIGDMPDLREEGAQSLDGSQPMIRGSADVNDVESMAMIHNQNLRIYILLNVLLQCLSMLRTPSCPFD